jgi:hypothetical protein
MVRIAKTCLYVGFGDDGDDGTLLVLLKLERFTLD